MRYLPTPAGIRPVKRRRPPMQPVVIAQDGRTRFQVNEVVRALLDEASARGFTLNELTVACHDAPRSDWEQFAQLIGYSIGGFSELSYVRNETYDRAAKRAEAAESKARNEPPEETK